MDRQDAAVGPVQPCEQQDVVAGCQAVSASPMFGSNTTHASGAPSSPCFGADARSVSGDCTWPIGRAPPAQYPPGWSSSRRGVSTIIVRIVSSGIPRSRSSGSTSSGMSS